MRRYKRLTIRTIMSRHVVLIVLLMCLVTYITLGRLAVGRIRLQFVPVLSENICQPFLCLFTTFRPGDYKIPVYSNTLRNWASLDADKCRVKTILYVANSSLIEDYVLAKLALQLDWQVYEAPKLNQRGIPIFKHMYMDAAKRLPNCRFYMYSNGDILYSYDIIETLEETYKDYKIWRIVQHHVYQSRVQLHEIHELKQHLFDISLDMKQRIIDSEIGE